MNILVLGGAGFLGSHLCERLVENGNDVTVFDRAQANYNNLNGVLNKIKIVQGDFADYDDFNNLLFGIDIVFHLISSTIPKTSNDNMLYDIGSNVLQTINLLSSCINNNIKKIIFFSSGGTVYGLPNEISIGENHPTDPICSYGIQKLTIEKYLQLFNTLYGMDYSILRLANPYGIRQNATSGQGAISTFILKALNNEAIEIWGDGSVVRDYIHVNDVIDAALLSINYNGQYKLFNLGSGKGFSLNDVTGIIKSLINKDLKIHYKSNRKIDVPINVLDIDRISREFNWQPKISLEEGVKEYLLLQR